MAARAVRAVAVTLVLVLPAAVTLELKHMGERGVLSERELQQVATELQVQDALEWRALSGRVPPQDVLEDLTTSRDRAALLLAHAHRGGSDTAEGQRLGGLHRDYGQLVDRQLQLLQAGQLEEAAEFDEQAVDPAFERVNEALAEVAGQVSARAARSRRLGDAGVLLTVLLSLGLTTLVQSRRKRAEVQRQSERASEARYRALIDQSADLVLVVDRAGLAHFVSPAVERLLSSCGGSEARGSRDLMATVAPDDRARLAAALQAARPGQLSTVEVRIASPAGLRTFDISLQDLTEVASVAGLVLTGHDITDRLVLQAEIEHRALHDTLTALPNRALLADRFDQALRAGHRDGTATGLLLIDLDRFKEINDTFGHHYGDALLTQVGPRLTAALREVDTVARWAATSSPSCFPTSPECRTSPRSPTSSRRRSRLRSTSRTSTWTSRPASGWSSPASTAPTPRRC